MSPFRLTYLGEIPTVGTLENIANEHGPPILVFLEDDGRDVAEGAEKVNQRSEIESVGDVLEDSRVKYGPFT